METFGTTICAFIPLVKGLSTCACREVVLLRQHSEALTLGQCLAELSLKARNKKYRSKKAWSEHMKKVRAAALDKRS